MECGETLEETGELAQWVVLVEWGYFSYMVYNDEEGYSYCTGFAFEDEFVSYFPYCLDDDTKKAKMDVKIVKNLFIMVYVRELNHYSYTTHSR